MPSTGHRLQRLFLTGLLTLLPVWLTWVVVKFVFVLLSDLSKPWVMPVSRGIAASDPRLFGWFDDPWTQTALALIATVLVILLVGWLARRVVELVLEQKLLTREQVDAILDPADMVGGS